MENGRFQFLIQLMQLKTMERCNGRELAGRDFHNRRIYKTENAQKAINVDHKEKFEITD